MGGDDTAFVKWIETMPPATACSAQWPTRPMWWAFRRPITHTP